jgi:nucleoid DNA-binding protein
MSRLSDIAKVIADKYKMNQSEAETFLEQFNSLIGDALRSDRIVKIKGIGTFRVTKVNSRESVDVNTGERIVIGERDKISFTPDTTMRDLVNRPFAQFATVVVNDGVDFSEIDEKYKNNDETEEEDVEESPQNEEEQVESSDDNADEKNEEESVPLVTPAEESAEEPKQDPDVCTPEEKIEPEPIIAEPSEQVNTIKVAEKKDESTSDNEPLEFEETPSTGEEKLSVDEETPTEEIPEEPHTHSKMIKIMLVSICVIVLLCVAGAFYFCHQLSLRDHRIEHLEAQTGINKTAVAKHQKSEAVSKANTSTTLSPDLINNIQQKEVKKAESEQHAEAVLQPKLKPVVAKEPAVKKKEITVSKPKTAENERKEMSSSFNKDARVRTGAYEIIGVDHIVTVGKGQTLYSISKANLGSGMECYVEAINGKTTFKAGEKIKIPKLKLKKRK